MIRNLLMFAFWAIAAPLGALVAFPWTFIRGNADFLYKVGTRIAYYGVRIAGVDAELVGAERLDWSKTYIFMSNHVSNLDPPLLIPLLPRRTSVLVKKELFRVPVLGQAMRLGSLVPIDRGNREKAVASVRSAAEVLGKGINLTIFPEGTRSQDGKLLPFKKGPFYLAMETGVPVVPVTLLNTFELWPKGQTFTKRGKAQIVFHAAIDPKSFPADGRDQLMAAVRDAISSSLPEERRG